MTPPVSADTYFTDANGRLVLQKPLLGSGQTSIRLDRQGRPIRRIEPAKPKAEPEEVVLASANRAPARYNRPSPHVIQNIRMVARRYQRDRALRKVDYSPKQWSALFQAMIKVESNYNPNARSHANAIGLAQIIPETARYLRINVNDPVQNLDGGARYLLEQIESFGDVRLALAAYNAGPQAVRKYAGIPPFRETKAHVIRVMAEYNRLLNTN